MTVWQFTTVLLLNCLVSAIVAYLFASARFLELAHRVSSMEAAVAAYWDRIRKRMRVEPTEVQPVQRDPMQMSEQEIIAAARSAGLLND